MTRVWTLAAAALVTVATGAAPTAHAEPSTFAAASSTRHAPEGVVASAVTSVSVLPAAGAAHVVIGIEGSVDVRHFTLRGPDRIVVDLTGARLGLSAQRYDRVGRGGVVDVRYGQNQPSVVRVVITLDRSRQYTVTTERGQIRIAVTGEGDSFAAWHAGSPSETVSQAAREAAAPATPATPRESERAPATAAAAEETYDHSRAVAPRPAQQRAQPRTQPRITVAWQNADIRDVLSAFAAFSGRTIIAGKNVQGTVTAEINDQPWDVAMKAILDAQGLAATQDENGIIVVDTHTEIANRMAALLQTQRNQPDSTVILPIENLSATVVAASLRGQLPQQCVGMGGSSDTSAAAAQQQQRAAISAAMMGMGGCRTVGSISADSVTNKVMISGPRTVVADLVRLAREIDRPERQVAIKAKIVLVQRSQLEQLGIQYDLRTVNQFEAGLINAPGSAGPQGTAGQVLIGGNVLSAISNATRAVTGPALRLVYSTAFGDYALTTFITMLQEMSLSDIQSEPSVTTLNNRTAELFSGTQVFFTPPQAVTPGAVLAAPQTQLIQAGVTLRVTPRISQVGGRIQMNIEARNSDFTPSPTQPLITEQRVTNEVTVSDGETVVLGGLTQTTVRVTRAGIPVLMDLPLIGRLFGFTSRGEDKRDLLILITPHIVDNPRSGTDARQQ